MNYNEFLEEVVRQIKERVDGETKVAVTEVLKNNQNRTCSLSILRKGENMSPAISLDAYYGQYCRGVSMESITDQILSCYFGNRKGGRFDISCYTDFEKVKDKIVCKLVSYEKNQYILSMVPHRRFLDLAVVYYYKLEDPVIGKASILIQNAHLELWGIGQGILQELADQNTLKLLPYEFLGIEELMKRITGVGIPYDVPDPVKLYVLTNTEQYYGAVNMTFGCVLDAVYQKLGRDYYVLPSSIHECMILEAEGSMTPGALRMMVEEINAECVEESEVLGNSVYRYYGKEKRLAIVD